MSLRLGWTWLPDDGLYGRYSAPVREEPIVPTRSSHNCGCGEDRNFPGRGLDHERTRLRVSNYLPLADHPGAISQGGANRDAKSAISTKSALINQELVAVRICSVCIGVSSLPGSQSGVASSLCLIVARARSREERVFPTATCRTMPPLSPVSPA